MSFANKALQCNRVFLLNIQDDINGTTLNIGHSESVLCRSISSQTYWDTPCEIHIKLIAYM